MTEADILRQFNGSFGDFRAISSQSTRKIRKLGISKNILDIIAYEQV